MLREVSSVEPSIYEQQQQADPAGVRSVAGFIAELSDRSGYIRPLRWLCKCMQEDRYTIAVMHASYLHLPLRPLTYDVSEAESQLHGIKLIT